MKWNTSYSKKTLIDFYYNYYNEEGRLEAKHGQVELITSRRYIE